MTGDNHPIAPSEEPEPEDPDTRAADLLTKWVVALIGAPVIIITVGELVSFPINGILAALHFDPKKHLIVFVITRIILVAWVSGSVSLIRMAWPSRKRRRLH